MNASVNRTKSQQSAATVKATGEIIEFVLSIISKNGKETMLSTFSKPITLKLNVRSNANTDLIGVYYMTDNGELTYNGGTLADGKMIVNVEHFSKYAVLEYDKTFEDVTTSYWVHDVIKQLVAKHIIAGVNETEFAPKKQVTRAEFAALVVRALGLKASKTVTFNDVESTKWYAEAIAAAHEAGIVSGRTADEFAPNAVITRQEMAIMIVRAYKLKSGVNVPGAAKASFVDGQDISAWALPAVNAAVEIGLLMGRGNNKFVPQGVANRAESAQVIYNLLK